MLFVSFFIAGAQQTKKKRKILDDSQKYAAYVAMHSVCMSRGGKFEDEDKKNLAKKFSAMLELYRGFGSWP